MHGGSPTSFSGTTDLPMRSPGPPDTAQAACISLCGDTGGLFHSLMLLFYNKAIAILSLPLIPYC